MEHWQIASLVVVAAAVGAFVTWLATRPTRAATSLDAVVVTAAATLSWLLGRAMRATSSSLNANEWGSSVWRWTSGKWVSDPTTTATPGHVAPLTPGPSEGYYVRVIAKKP